MPSIEDILTAVADELAWLDPEPVFVGGATIGLFLDDFGRSQLRVTDDVDCIVPEVATKAAWWRLEAALRQRGWAPEPSGPICRYRSPGGHLVDLMAEDPTVLGFAGRWYAAAVAHATPREVSSGHSVRVPAVPYLFACKLEAWEDRGAQDPTSSRDLEDIVALADGCVELVEAVRGADTGLRAYVASTVSAIRDNPNTLDVAVAQLPRGGDSQRQEQRFLRIVDALCGM